VNIANSQVASRITEIHQCPEVQASPSTCCNVSKKNHHKMYIAYTKLHTPAKIQFQIRL
jgi:hypothetical protein